MSLLDGTSTHAPGPMSARVVVAVLGPTASGKSALGVALAAQFGGEVVACDSTAVYRGFDIGTDKVPRDEQRGSRTISWMWCRRTSSTPPPTTPATRRQ